MGLRTGSSKWQRSAASYVDYVEEGKLDSAEASLKYHDRPRDGIVFDHVRGKATGCLPGLNLELGLTKAQHADLHAGRWDGVQHLKAGYAKVWLTDAHGRIVYEENLVTGKRERIPVIDPETGKQKIEPVHTAGYDLSFSVSKDVDEYLVAHPQDVPVIQQCLLKAVDTAMSVAVEEYAHLVRVPVLTPAQVGARTTLTQGSKTERVRADGLIWWSIFGSAARPTPEALARGYFADPHNHVHVFLSSMAWHNGRWRKLDGSALMKTADFRRDVADVMFANLLEEAGFELEYSDPDRKGRRHWEIKGSKVENRRYLSTNSDRKHALIAAYEAEHNAPMPKRLLDAAMQATKGVKTNEAKLADQGTLEQYDLWKTSLERDGLSIDMPARGAPKQYEHIDRRIAELHRRLEAPDGLNRYCENTAAFRAEVVLPATVRAGIGLGLTPVELRTLATEYLDRHLVPVPNAENPEVPLYTTKTIQENEQAVMAGLDKLASRISPSVPREAVYSVLGRQKQALDRDQVRFIKAATGSSRLVNLIGPAGSGKGAALDVVAQVLRETDDYKELVVTSVAAKRAGELARELGAHRGGSIESLYRQWEKGWRPTERSVIVVDEAYLANSFDAAKLMQIAGGKAKVILVGDPIQAPSINSAGWFEHEVAKRPPMELTGNHRQADTHDQQMLKALREGRSEVAVQMLHERNRIMVAERTEDMMALVYDRYAIHRESGRSVTDVVIVHQGLNEELDQYNRAVQRWRAEHGEINPYISFVAREASTGRRWTLNKGDRVIFLENVWQGRKSPIRNGTTGELLGIDSRGVAMVRLDHDRQKVLVPLKSEMHRVPLGLEYAQVSTKYQGGEAKVILSTQGSPGITSRNSIYSQLSRMVEHVEVLLDRQRWSSNFRETLSKVWANQVTKTMASDIIEGQEIAETPRDHEGQHRSIPAWEAADQDTKLADQDMSLADEMEWEDELDEDTDFGFGF